MESPRPTKRQRRSSDDNIPTLMKRQRRDSEDSLPTPPASERNDSKGEGELEINNLIKQATHVLATEAAALAHVTSLFQTNANTQASLTSAVQAIFASQQNRGKLIVCAVGKSAYIAQKLVATCKSLSINSSFLHACEAAHGDLGDVHPEDVLLFVTFSGKTPELLNLLPHIPSSTQLIAISSHLDTADCLLLRDQETGILLPAPISESEESSFGVGAPTTSTTVALAVADMLALTLAQQMHGTKNKTSIFKRNHPGGAIGMNHREVEELKKKEPKIEVSILELPSPSISGADDC